MLQAFTKQASQGLFGRGFKAGMMESVGFHMENVGSGLGRSYTNHGFLGRKLAGGWRANKLAIGGNALGLAAMGYSMYQGYKEGGLVGAAKEGVIGAATWGAVKGTWNYAMGAGNLAMGAGLGIGAVAAGAYGYYRAGEAGQKYAKRLRNLEMGADIVDNFGTMSTMRGRSIDAIQSSRVNGRNGLGNEAALMHVSGGGSRHLPLLR